MLYEVITVVGAVGNLNKHSASAFCRVSAGSGVVGIIGDVGYTAIPSSVITSYSIHYTKLYELMTLSAFP